MADTSTDVLVAGYQDIDAATEDFESLVAQVKAKRVKIDGVLLVTHAEDGTVAVEQGHSGWRGPVGRFVDHRLEGEIHEKIGENAAGGLGRDHRGVPRGAAAGDRAGARRRGDPLVVQDDKAGMAAALKESLAEAMHKFEPDRTQLPIPDREFGGTAGRTFDAVGRRLVDDPRPEAADGRAERADLSDRRRRLRRSRTRSAARSRRRTSRACRRWV